MSQPDIGSGMFAVCLALAGITLWPLTLWTSPQTASEQPLPSAPGPLAD